MENQHLRDIDHFFVVGINYRKADATLRGMYAINNDQYENILKKAAVACLPELFVLSTCNRTEIYGFAWNAHQLVDLLCSETAGDKDSFTSSAYIKRGNDAIEHVFHVGAGLDSQILGDYEIIGQLKLAVKFAKERGFIGAFSERLVNSVLQSSKLIKNNTQLSGGTVSVAFAAVQYIKNNIKDPAYQNILLLGIGKIGKNTCKNLVDYLGTKNLTLMNRSPEKAEELAQLLGLRSASLENLTEECKKADIILVATNSDKPVVLKEHLSGNKEKLVIDLSIPCNVDQGAETLVNVKMINVDMLSKMRDETLKMREAEVPKAKEIISEVMYDFTEWYQMRRHVPMLKNLKLKLKELYTHPQYIQTTSCPKTIDVHIQRVLNDTAGRVKHDNQRGCQYIAALNAFISKN